MRRSVTLFLALVLAACATTSGSFATVEGTTYDMEKMDQVKAGMKLESVLALVGEPIEKTVTGEGTVYRYHMVREKLDYDRAMGVLAVEKKTVRSDTVELLFADDGFLLKKTHRFSETGPEDKKD